MYTIIKNNTTHFNKLIKISNRYFVFISYIYDKCIINMSDKDRSNPNNDMDDGSTY